MESFSGSPHSGRGLAPLGSENSATKGNRSPNVLYYWFYELRPHALPPRPPPRHNGYSSCWPGGPNAPSLTVTLSHRRLEDRRDCDLARPCCTHLPPPLSAGASSQIERTHSWPCGGFSLQGLLFEEGETFGRLQNSRGPAKRGESAAPLG